MLQNYFFLNRFVIEANSLVAGSKILDIFSQEKNKIIIALHNGGAGFFLEICVTPGSSFINIRQKYSRAKKNTLSFFSSVTGDKISGIYIAEDDRIIKLRCRHSAIYFAIRGKFTNVFHFGADGTEEAFKAIDEQLLKEIKKELEGKNFINHFNKPDLKIEFKGDYLESIRKKYPFIGSEIIKEVKVRASAPDSYPQILAEVLSDIETGKPAVFIEENLGEVNIGFWNSIPLGESFKSFPSTKIELFDDLFSAQNFFFSNEHFISTKQEKIKLIKKHLEKELNRVSNKINNLSAVIEKGSKEEEYNKLGNLLLINLSLVKSGMNEITVDDIYGNGSKVKIKLNPALSLKKNVDYYFDKSKSEKTGFAKSQELIQKTRSDFERLKKIKQRVEETETIDELNSIMKELKIKSQASAGGQKIDKEDLKLKFKHYLIEDNYQVFVGKDSKNNDLLTTKFAKQNDYWFHARGASGSHVVLRVENTKETVPKNILKKAAALAAYHSKAKTSGMVPVAYTLKKYVVKKKGDPIGTVHLLREDVLIVKPEIPDGCEFVTT